MPPLSHFPDPTILDWWAEAPVGSDYTHVARNAYLYAAISVSIPESRRHVKRTLRRHGLLPTQRPNTSYDYARAKLRWRSLRDAEVMN